MFKQGDGSQTALNGHITNSAPIRKNSSWLTAKKVIDHYENPRNVGSFDNSDENVGSGMVGAGLRRDVMKLQIKVNNEGIIEDARFFQDLRLRFRYRFQLLVTEWVGQIAGRSAGDQEHRYRR